MSIFHISYIDCFGTTKVYVFEDYEYRYSEVFLERSRL